MTSSGMPIAGAGRIRLEAEPEPIAIDPSMTALVIVDMQNAYLSAGGDLDRVGFDVSTSGPVIETAARVLAAAHAAGLFVVHLQNGFDALQTQAGGPTAPVWHKSNALKYMRANPSARGTLITHGRWDHEIVDALRDAYHREFFAVMVPDATLQAGLISSLKQPFSTSNASSAGRHPATPSSRPCGERPDCPPPERAVLRGPRARIAMRDF